MTKIIDAGRGFKPALFLFLALTLSSCYSIKNVPVKDINGQKSSKQIMYVHTENNIWMVADYRSMGYKVIGVLVDNIGEVTKKQILHIYVAPADAVKIDGFNIEIPIENIGKADYRGIDGIKLAGLILDAGFILFMLLIIGAGAN